MKFPLWSSGYKIKDLTKKKNFFNLQTDGHMNLMTHKFCYVWTLESGDQHGGARWMNKGLEQEILPL